MSSLKTKAFQGLFVIFCLSAAMVLYVGVREVGPALGEAKEQSVDNIFRLVDLNVIDTYNYLLNEKIADIDRYKQRLYSDVELAVITFDQLDRSGVDRSVAQESALKWILQTREKLNTDWRIISKSGQYISHPDTQRIGTSALKVKDLFGRPVVEKVSSDDFNQKSEYIVFNDPFKRGGKQLGIFYYFSTWDWVIAHMVDLGDVEFNYNQKQQEVLQDLQNSFNQINLPGNGSAFIFNSQLQSLVAPKKSFSDTYLPQLDKIQKQIIANVKTSSDGEASPSFILIENELPGKDSLQVYASYSELFDFYTAVASPEAALIKPVSNLLWQQGTVVALIFLIGFMLALMYLNKITTPLLQLVATMRKVSETGNYSLRSDRDSNDEIGLLVDGFNEMLQQIEVRGHELEDHKKFLEQTVSERTAELHESVKSLELAKQSADLANQSKSTFLANMTHELRTPLVGIMGMNELMIESRLDDHQRFLAKTIEGSAQDLLQLINQILDFSRIETDNLQLHPEPVDLLELVENVVFLIGKIAYQKGLDVVLNVDSDASWQVMADPQRIRQILLNLISNAIKFTEQGYVGIELTRSENDHFCFKISDTGIGLTAQEQEIVFEAFSQIDETSARVFDGTGLGLSIVRELVELMSGQVRVESQPGVGSIFEVELTFPLVQETFIQLPESLHEESALLYDPCQATRDAYRKLLSDLGFSTVLVFSDTGDALRKLESAAQDNSPFELVVLASGGTGSELDKLIRHAEKASRTLVCLQKGLTGSTGQSGVIFVYGPALRRDLIKHYVQNQDGTNQESQQTLEPNPASLERVTASQNSRILIVDDKETNRMLVRLILDKYGWEYDEAANADEVFIAIAHQDYSLILIDINLPGTDGMQITQSLREQGLDTPIYAMTAHGEEHVFELCVKSGMQGILRKPFRKRELLAILENHQKHAQENDQEDHSQPLRCLN
ncbi:MAG: hypothetical protein C0615_10045 [Desulfuromonas sp.]|nr:MAG: hypothetical protein C0615_10045 [Desulfuromonas sp.]